MDRYNIIVKIEQIKECLNDNKNDEALDIAADIDPAKVKESYHLMILAKVFAANGMLAKAKSCYEKVYAKNRTRHVAMELANLSIRLKNVVEADHYLDEFKEMAPDHYMRHVFKYKIDRLKGKSVPDLIDSLEKLKKEEFFENWGFELAKLYNKNGDSAKCVATCNDVIIWFSEGEYVDRAKLLKASITGDRSELGKNEAELVAIYGQDGTLSAKKLAKQQAEKDKNEGKGEDLGQTKVISADERAAIQEKAALAEGQTVVFGKVTENMPAGQNAKTESKPEQAADAGIASDVKGVTGKKASGISKENSDINVSSGMNEKAVVNKSATAVSNGESADGTNAGTREVNEKTVKGKKNQRKKDKLRKKYGNAVDIQSGEPAAMAVEVNNGEQSAKTDEVNNGEQSAKTAEVNNEEQSAKAAEVNNGEQSAKAAEVNNGEQSVMAAEPDNGESLAMAAEALADYEKAAAESTDADEALIYKLLAEEDKRIAAEKAEEEARRAEKARRRDEKSDDADKANGRERADEAINKVENAVTGKKETDSKKTDDTSKKTESALKTEQTKSQAETKEQKNAKTELTKSSAETKAQTSEETEQTKSHEETKEQKTGLGGLIKKGVSDVKNFAAERKEAAAQKKEETGKKENEQKKDGEFERMATVREEEDIYEPQKPKCTGNYSGGVLDRFLKENNKNLEEYFAYFACNDNICVQLVQSLDVMLSDKKYLSYCLQCEKGSGKKAVINGMTRLLNDAGQLSSAKPVWSDADGVNNIELEAKAAKLKGRCLAIDKAGKLNERSVQSIINLMKTEEMAIILVDYGRNIKKLTKDYEELEELMLNKIELPAFGVKELEEFADYKAAAAGLVYSTEAHEKLLKKIKSIAKNSEEGVLAATEKVIAKIIDNTETRNAEALVKQALSGDELCRTDVITAADIPEE